MRFDPVPHCDADVDVTCEHYHVRIRTWYINRTKFQVKISEYVQAHIRVTLWPLPFHFKSRRLYFLGGACVQSMLISSWMNLAKGAMFCSADSASRASRYSFRRDIRTMVHG